MTFTFGFCVPIFAGAKDHHPRTPLVERLDVNRMLEAVREAEALGYDSLWVADHLMLGRDDWILEGWTLLSALARITSRPRLGSIHLANLFRHPSITAKMVASLDVISGGRVDFFFEPGHKGSIPEATAYGFDWEEDETRLARFEEAIAVIRAMWTQENPTFQGRFYSIQGAICYPRPVQDPVPLWIGTIGGEPFSQEAGMDELMVDVIARHAQWWNNTPASVDHCRQRLDMLREACRRNGRDYDAIAKSLETQVLIAEDEVALDRLKGEIERLNPRRAFYEDWEALEERYVIGTPDRVRRRLEEYADLGITCFMLWFLDYPSFDGMRLFATEVAPHFRGEASP